MHMHMKLSTEVRHFTVTVYLSVFPAAFHQFGYILFTIVRNGWVLYKRENGSH